MEVEAKSFWIGMSYLGVVLVLSGISGWAGWSLKPPVKVEVQALILTQQTRDAAVKIASECIKKGKDVYWDAMNSATLRGESIHVACPMKGKPARRTNIGK